MVDKNLTKELANKGRGGDTMLSHINPREAELLKIMGGSGEANPNTGLPEYKFSLKKKLQQLAPYIAIAVAIFAPEFIPSIGAALGAPAGAAAAAAGSAAIAGGVTALSGGTPEQIAKNALIGGAGGYAGAAVSGSDAAIGLGQTSKAALAGAASGGTQAALTGQDVIKGAAKGGATAGLTSGLQQGYQSILGPQTDYSIAPGDKALGLKPSATNIDTLASTYGSSSYAGPQGLTASMTPSSDYSLAPQGNEASGIGIQSAGFSPDSSVTKPAELSSLDKAIASYISKSAVNKAFPSSTTTAGAPASGQTSDVALGSQQSPSAISGTEVAQFDVASPEGVGGVKGKKGGKYPWGDPEGTTALKQEGQVI